MRDAGGDRVAGRAALDSARVRVSLGARGSQRGVPVLLARLALFANAGAERRCTRCSCSSSSILFLYLTT